jgi:hypothetical protein
VDELFESYGLLALLSADRLDSILRSRPVSCRIFLADPADEVFLGFVLFEDLGEGGVGTSFNLSKW